MRDRNNPYQFYHVDFYEPGTTDFAPGNASHNDIVSTFHELCFLADGRTFVIRGPATAEQYLENLELQRA